MPQTTIGLRLPTRTLLGALAALWAAAFAPAQVQVTVTPTARHQTIEGLGAAASGTWDPQVRELFEQPSFQAMIRDDLGLSIARVNIQDGIQPAEDLNPETLDWARFDFTPMDPAANFVAALNAPRPGAVKLIGTVWTPPGWMKTNGSPMNGGQLRADRLQHFGKFCAGACLGIQTRYGVPVYAINLQNEPVFVESYESCVYSPTQYRDAVHALATAFATWQVPTMLFGPEDVGTDPARWFSFATALTTDPVAIQRMDRLALHHYPFGSGGDQSSPAAWTALRQQVAALGKPMWQTERSGEDPSWLGAGGNPKGALSMAVSIHDALVYGEVTAWLYWVISDPVPSQYALMALDQPTKKYYAAKQFYRFVRPGAVRVDASSSGSNLLASAYVHDSAGSMTVVLINRSTTPTSAHVTLAPGAPPVGNFATIRSSATENAAALAATPVINGQADVSVPAQSIVTLYSACYPNCDGSTGAPTANVADFTCFLQKYAEHDAYANCDGSTGTPAVNVADFTCFLQKYASGCSIP